MLTFRYLVDILRCVETNSSIGRHRALLKSFILRSTHTYHKRSFLYGDHLQIKLLKDSFY